MHASMRVRGCVWAGLRVGAVAAAAGAASPALGQECLWTSHSSPPGMSSGAVVYHSRLGKVVLLEGQTAAGVRGWAWDGAGWAPVAAPSLLYRTNFAAAYDARRDRVVVFGGRQGAGNYPIDTWEWDGEAWFQLAASGPSGREAHGMVYDEARHRTVLFGGERAQQLLGDTWEFDGQQWVAVGAGGPSARTVGAMEYDPTRGRTVLMGRSSWPQDWWEWDGSTWTERPALATDSLTRWMAFDRGRGVMVVGRQVPEAPYWRSETIDLDTATGQLTVRSPDYSGSGWAAYDAGRGRVVVVSSATQEFNPAGTLQPAVFREQGLIGVGTHPLGGTMELSAAASGSELLYQWFHAGQPLSDDGRITGSATLNLTIRNLVYEDHGLYALRITNSCGLAEAQGYVTLRPSCYPNCDGSTVSPILNVNDFVCFQTMFARGDPYANCDDSSTPPMFNVNDFLCFMWSYSNGCP